MNLPSTIAVVVSSRLATLTELDTVLGAEDLQNLLEISAVDARNQRIAASRLEEP